MLIKINFHINNSRLLFWEQKLGVSVSILRIKDRSLAFLLNDRSKKRAMAHDEDLYFRHVHPCFYISHLDQSRSPHAKRQSRNSGHCLWPWSSQVHSWRTEGDNSDVLASASKRWPSQCTASWCARNMTYFTITRNSPVELIVGTSSWCIPLIQCWHKSFHVDITDIWVISDKDILKYFHQELLIRLNQNILRQCVRFVNKIVRNLFKYAISQRN